MVCAALLTVDLKDDATEGLFWPKMADFQNYCLRCEPGTLTYEFQQLVENDQPVPHKYILIERYSARADFDLHSNSAYMKEIFAFLATLNNIEATLQRFEGDELRCKLQAFPKRASYDVESGALLSTKGVLVFCGSRPGAQASYALEAASLGEYLATNEKRPLVYGGGTVGIMGVLAYATHQHGGRIVSIIPRALCPREASGELIGDRIFFTETMTERKSIMFAAADTVVALPGGIGTFDELLEVLTLFQLNAYRPKMGLVNVNGFFDPFVAMLRHLTTEGFLENSVFDSFVIKPTAREVMETLKTFTPPESPAAKLLWHTRP